MIYFVTETYFKNNTTAGNNVDDKLIVPSIKNASESYVKSIIGKAFYKYLLNAFNNQTLNPDEVELVEDYIKPSIAWRALAEVTIASSYQITNKGQQTQSGDYSQSAEYKAIMFNFHHISDKASLYDNNLSEYISSDKDKFPQFWADDNKMATARRCCDKGNNFNTNIFFI